MSFTLTLTPAMVRQWLANATTGSGEPAINFEPYRSSAVEEMKSAAEVFGLEVIDQTGERPHSVVRAEWDSVPLDDGFVRVARTGIDEWIVGGDFGDDTRHPTKEAAITHAEAMIARRNENPL